MLFTFGEPVPHVLVLPAERVTDRLRNLRAEPPERDKFAARSAVSPGGAGRPHRNGRRFAKGLLPSQRWSCMRPSRRGQGCLATRI